MYSITIHRNHKAEILATFDCDCGVRTTEIPEPDEFLGREVVECKFCHVWVDISCLMDNFRIEEMLRQAGVEKPAKTKERFTIKDAMHG